MLTRGHEPPRPQTAVAEAVAGRRFCSVPQVPGDLRCPQGVSVPQVLGEVSLCSSTLLILP